MFRKYATTIGHLCHFSRINCEFWLYLSHRLPSHIKRLHACLHLRNERTYLVFLTCFLFLCKKYWNLSSQESWEFSISESYVWSSWSCLWSVRYQVIVTSTEWQLKNPSKQINLNPIPGFHGISPQKLQRYPAAEMRSAPSKAFLYEKFHRDQTLFTTDQPSCN